MLDVVSVELNLVARAFPLKNGQNFKEKQNLCGRLHSHVPSKVLLVLVLKSFYSDLHSHCRQFLSRGGSVRRGGEGRVELLFE